MVSFLYMIGITMFAITASQGDLSVQPGKQLPQCVTVSTGEGGAGQSVPIPFLLFVPRDYTTTEKPWPLLLFLHGLGESGDGDLDLVKIHGPASIAEKQPNFPFVVVSPQCPEPKNKKNKEEVREAWKADQLMRLVDHVAGKLHVDTSRIYVTGLSMGGFGTWRLAATYPERFAAAVPICGGGKPETMAASLSRVPIWCFHGAKDITVPVQRTQEMVDAVRQAGGDVRMTIYKDAEHNSWSQTYDNQEVYDWLLSHRRPGEADN